ncbi:MAG: Two-component sensor histidine kinase [Hyphomicrobiales bacterium]|nr:Two-component sensor histidine kinase [Hyphomicrobiales bacterium]
MSIALPSSLDRSREAWRGMMRWLAARMPKGLYARSLLIVIVPMVLLQSAIAYFFMERHWQTVTQRLSAAVVSDIGSMIDLLESRQAPQDLIAAVAERRFGFDVKVLPREPLPPALPKPFFSLLDSALSRELSELRKPFWIDTVGNSKLVEVRVQTDVGVLRILTHRSAAYASNSHIFLIWMVATSLVLLGVAIAFLRNQIRPILRLSRAAEDFGKGRDFDFRPHGALEVRKAGYSFIEMKRRIERAIEQRTAMLNGVSHDLRTILTRFRLSLAMLPDGPDTEAMQKDVEEMQRMLEAYLAFARGAGGEQAAPTDMRTLLEELKADAERHGHPTSFTYTGDPLATVRPDAFKRCLTNLVANAQRHGDKLAIEATREQRFLTVNVDDDGPGIPPDDREDVFRPFYRLDEARNQDHGGTGLGLAIARDIARAHGGDISLGVSPLGGLRASVRVPI